MADDRWSELSLADLVDIRHGYAFDGKYFRDEPPGDILLTPGNFAIGGGFQEGKPKYYDGPVPSDFVLREGDLLVTMTDLSKNGDTLGYPAFVPPTGNGARYLHNQRLGKVLVRPDAPADVHYLYQLLRTETYRAEVLSSATGSTVRHTSPDRIKAFRFRLPPLPEQRAIARILGALDDKIELNRRMNATLEALARALFTCWFVDFDPVRAKAEGRQPPGMDAATAALFPDGFEESAIGPIPRGWRVGAFGAVAGINERSVTDAYPHSEIEYVDIASVRMGELAGTRSYALADAPSRARRLVGDGDTIWSSVRPNLKAYLFIHEPPPNMVVSTGFAVLTPHAIPPSYLYAWTTTDSFVDYLAANADGSAYPAVRADRFAEASILLPSSSILAAFESLVGPIRDKIAHNHLESRTLAAMRDTLLPKLLSGAVRVREAETMVEVAT